MSETVKPPLNPENVICVCKHDGREVGRVAATASNAEAYMIELTRHYGDIQVDYVDDPEAAAAARMVGSLFRR